MAPELSRDELNGLLAAYALDAVDGDERHQVERYLERNPQARAEVAAYRETAALLAHAGADAPAGLWDRIAGAMEEEPPGLELPGSPDRPSVPAIVVPLAPRRRAISLRVAAVVGVAAAVVIALLGLQVARDDRRLNHVGAKQSADSAQRQQGARFLTLKSADGVRRADVVYLPDGTGYLFENNLRPLPSDRTYQLWALVGDARRPSAISAGVLGNDPGVSPFRFDGKVFGFAVTDEKAPGVVSSDRPTLLQGVFAEA
jgi:hypothetical protein